MCFCFRNYKGADCSRRVCPYGHAFVTTPQGDLNHGRTHQDCRNNGIDENDSDGPPRKNMYEGEDNNAAHCHNGGICMCSDGFYGRGCTRTGRGHHANYRVTVSGDIYNLKCDSYPYCYVTRKLGNTYS